MQDASKERKRKEEFNIVRKEGVRKG